MSGLYGLYFFGHVFSLLYTHNLSEYYPTRQAHRVGVERKKEIMNALAKTSSKREES
jgi:hypothetical protein